MQNSTESVPCIRLIRAQCGNSTQPTHTCTIAISEHNACYCQQNNAMQRTSATMSLCADRLASSLSLNASTTHCMTRWYTVFCNTQTAHQMMKMMGTFMSTTCALLTQTYNNISRSHCLFTPVHVLTPPCSMGRCPQSNGGARKGPMHV